MVTIADAAGSYRLSSIAWSASVPFEPLPAWTWPGRSLVLEGALVLRVEGRFMRAARGRLTMFGDTTFTASTDSGAWSIRGDTVWLQGDPRNAPEPARLRGRVLTTYAGGFASGGTQMRFIRE